jgi:uncharacterized protein
VLAVAAALNDGLHNLQAAAQGRHRDSDLDALYKAARARPGIADGQRAFIRGRDAWTDAACIARAYDLRIGELRAALR